MVWVGEVDYLITSRFDLNTWLKVKEALQLWFADQRSTDCLIHGFIFLKAHINEKNACNLE